MTFWIFCPVKKTFASSTTMEAAEACASAPTEEGLALKTRHPVSVPVSSTAPSLVAEMLASVTWQPCTACSVLSMTIHAETLGRHRACTKARLFRETEAPDAPDAAVVPLYPLISSERGHLPGLAASFTALR